MNLSSVPFIFILFVGLLSCSDDQDKKPDNSPQLIGEWLRSDSDESFEYTFVFYEDNTGYRAVGNSQNGTATSSAMGLQWSINNEQLKLTIDEEIIETQYVIYSDGHLYLNAISEYHFEKVD